MLGVTADTQWLAEYSIPNLKIKLGQQGMAWEAQCIFATVGYIPEALQLFPPTTYYVYFYYRLKEPTPPLPQYNILIVDGIEVHYSTHKLIRPGVAKHLTGIATPMG